MILLSAEHLALHMAKGLLARGENPGPNTTAMLVATIERLGNLVDHYAQHIDWTIETLQRGDEIPMFAERRVGDAVRSTPGVEEFARFWEGSECSGGPYQVQFLNALCEYLDQRMYTVEYGEVVNMPPKPNPLQNVIDRLRESRTREAQGQVGA